MAEVVRLTMAAGALAVALLGGCAAAPAPRVAPARQAARALVLASTCDEAEVVGLSGAFAGRSDTSLGAFREPVAQPAVGEIVTQQRLRIIDGRPHEHTWFRWREWQELSPGLR